MPFIIMLYVNKKQSPLNCNFIILLIELQSVNTVKMPEKSLYFAAADVYILGSVMICLACH